MTEQLTQYAPKRRNNQISPSKIYQELGVSHQTWVRVIEPLCQFQTGTSEDQLALARGLVAALRQYKVLQPPKKRTL